VLGGTQSAGRAPARVQVDEMPLHASFGELAPQEVRQVRRTSEEAFFDSLLEHHCYLDYGRRADRLAQLSLRRTASPSC